MRSEDALFFKTITSSLSLPLRLPLVLSVSSSFLYALQYLSFSSFICSARSARLRVKMQRRKCKGEDAKTEMQILRRGLMLLERTSFHSLLLLSASVAFPFSSCKCIISKTAALLWWSHWLWCIRISKRSERDNKIISSIWNIKKSELRPFAAARPEAMRRFLRKVILMKATFLKSNNGS